MDMDEEKDKKVDDENNDQYNDADVVFENADEDGEAGTQEEALKALREKLKRCREERQEYLEGWQRARADFVNARRDDERARADFAKFAAEKVVLEVLPAIDSFDMAFGNKAAWEQAPKEWRGGIEQIYAQLLSVLKRNNMEVFNPVGERFNPQEHTSIGSVPVEDQVKDQTVAEVVQKGYRLHGRVIRPAIVKVFEK